jgi:hypothetical protein
MGAGHSRARRLYDNSIMVNPNEPGEFSPVFSELLWKKILNVLCYGGALN